MVPCDVRGHVGYTFQEKKRRECVLQWRGGGAFVQFAPFQVSRGMVPRSREFYEPMISRKGNPSAAETILDARVLDECVLIHARAHKNGERRLHRVLESEGQSDRWMPSSRETAQVSNQGLLSQSRSKPVNPAKVDPCVTTNLWCVLCVSDVEL